MSALQGIVTYVRRRPGLKAGLMVFPAAAWLLVFQVVPLILIVIVSLADRGTHGGIDWEFSLDNYARFTEPLYLGILWESFTVAALVTGLCLLLGYPFAYFVAHQPPSSRNTWLLLIVIPFWTNALVRTYSWIFVLRGNGLLNQALLGLGLTQEPLTLIYTRGASILGLVYVLLPFAVLPLYTSIEKLDRSLVRAAYDLGARPARAFLQVVLPLTMPGVVAATILTFVPSIGLFYVSDLMGGSKHILIGNLIHKQFTQARNWPFGAAASVVMTAASLLLIFIYLKFFSPKGEEEGLL